MLRQDNKGAMKRAEIASEGKQRGKQKDTQNMQSLAYISPCPVDHKYILGCSGKTSKF